MATKEMSAYERDRLERIKENQKMLEELFPDGTPDIVLTGSRTRKRRTQADSQGGTGSGSESDEDNPKPKRVVERRLGGQGMRRGMRPSREWVPHCRGGRK